MSSSDLKIKILFCSYFEGKSVFQLLQQPSQLPKENAKKRVLLPEKPVIVTKLVFVSGFVFVVLWHWGLNQGPLH